jgi:hypothetical protein
MLVTIAAALELFTSLRAQMRLLLHRALRADALEMRP